MKTRLDTLTDARGELRRAHTAYKNAKQKAAEIIAEPLKQYRVALAKAARLIGPWHRHGATKRQLDAEIQKERSKPKECCPANGKHGPLPGGCGCHCHEI